MALIERDVVGFVNAQFDPRFRYRCLVLQSEDMAIVARLRDILPAGLCFGGDPEVVNSADLFDDVGALACNEVVNRLEKAAVSRPVVLAGPLHFLDFWSEQVCKAFWDYLACFTRGPGIIVVDTKRSKGIDGSFHVLGRIPSTDIRYLKSRLASTEVN